MSDNDTPIPDAFQQATINQLTGVLKLILTSLGTYLVQRGLIDQQSMGELAAGLAALIAALAWMLWSRRKNGVVKAAANVLEGQGVIVAPQAMADKLPNNVVASVEEAEALPGVKRKASRVSAH